MLKNQKKPIATPQQKKEHIGFFENSLRVYAAEKFQKERKYGVAEIFKAPFKPALFITTIVSVLAAIALLIILSVGNIYSTQFNLKISDLSIIYLKLMMTFVVCIFIAAYSYIALVAQVISMFLSHRNGALYQIIGVLCSIVMSYQIGTMVNSDGIAWFVIVPTFLFLVWCIYAYKVFNELYELPQKYRHLENSWTKDI